MVTTESLGPAMDDTEERRPRVSVLSAVWNESAHVAEMISSVQSQDMPEWELLCVDDGSSDGTAEIIRAYALRDSRVRMASEGAKIGKVSAFNRAFAASKGEVIVLLGGDDRIPPWSLRTRYEALASLNAKEPAVAYSKVRYFSEDRRFDGLVVPKGSAGSHSGGSLAMNRVLAEILFPIDESLMSEDIWLGYGSELLASSVAIRPEVVVEGRVHAGNSMQRGAGFVDMSESIHHRYRAWRSLAEAERLPLDVDVRRALAGMWLAEELRYEGRLVRLGMFRALSLKERAALLSRAHPVLYWLRMRFFRSLTGLRGR